MKSAPVSHLWRDRKGRKQDWANMKMAVKKSPQKLQSPCREFWTRNGPSELSHLSDRLGQWVTGCGPPQEGCVTLGEALLFSWRNSQGGQQLRTVCWQSSCSWGTRVFISEGRPRWCISVFTTASMPFCKNTPHYESENEGFTQTYGASPWCRQKPSASGLVHGYQASSHHSCRRRVEKEVYVQPLPASLLRYSDIDGWWHRWPPTQTPQENSWLSSWVLDRSAFMPPLVLFLLSNFNQTNHLSHT